VHVDRKNLGTLYESRVAFRKLTLFERDVREWKLLNRETGRGACCSCELFCKTGADVDLHVLRAFDFHVKVG
jgi:hypothetical protein